MLKPMIQKAGFINITHRICKIPLGPWAADKKQKEMGAYILLSVQTGFEAFGMKLFTNIWEMSSSEAKTLIEEVKRDANSKKVHGYGIQ